jgi:phosphoglycolate phosphatase-like HAD superfamily hydrolase
VRLVIIDLIPALLSWEGRDVSEEPMLAPGAEEALEHLFSHYRLAAIADAGWSGVELRAVLEDEGLDGLFESVGTSADFGPAVSPRVVRRLASTVGVPADLLVFVTGRDEVADAVAASGIAVVHTTQDGFEHVPEAVAELIGDRLSP